MGMIVAQIAARWRVILNYNLLVVSRPFKFPPLAAIFSLTLAVLVALAGAGGRRQSCSTGGTGETWRHLLATVLPEYVSNSIWLCLGVGLGVAAMGTGAQPGWWR
jgi:iron(III) transport system permease protein